MTAHKMIREPLPARRRAELVTLEVNGSPFYEVGIGRYDDGRLAEVFISCVRPTSESAEVARDAAVLISIALQFGVPVETMQGAITRVSDGSAASIIGRVLDLLDGRKPPAQDR